MEYRNVWNKYIVEFYLKRGKKEKVEERFTYANSIEEVEKWFIPEAKKRYKGYRLVDYKIYEVK